MRKISRRTGIALATAAGLTAAVPAAFATTTFTVTASSATPGTVVGWAATTTGTTPQINFEDTTSGGVAFGCNSGTAPGATTVGSGLSGTGIASIDAAGTTWLLCYAAGYNVTFTGNGTWLFNAISGNGSGVSGNITNINLSVHGTNSLGTTCAFTVTGSVPATYTNANTTLAINGGGLAISDVSGNCGSSGPIFNGDAATLQASYVVSANSSADNPIAVTAP
jgi:hypothetical protein